MSAALIDEVKATLDRHMDLPGMQVEIRTYTWETGEGVVSESDYFCFSQTLKTRDRTDPIHWKLPGSRRFTTFGWLGVATPGTPIEVRRTPDVVKTFVLRVEPDTFHRITRLEDGWYNERLMYRANKEGVVPIRLLNEIATELTSPGHESESLISALCIAFLVRFARMVRAGLDEASGRGLGEWQMNRIRNMISTQPANRLSIDRLAESCGISGRHLMRGFKAVMGTTVHGYIDHVRMERTKHLLSATKMPLETIATQVGFASASHMSSTFSRAQGMAPSVFRQRFQR
ncbi:helix-turn-helix domain-containing protein [Sphingomonas bacterium]|uniref:helix-turn-helix domain-containing protein n=1 Tax=Sphingomonas bacterium TaxID=1895847 RepID=UPI001575AB7D|nr:AraC family transcriptional regulator [Sphingomonas bacterium]